MKDYTTSNTTPMIKALQHLKKAGFKNVLRIEFWSLGKTFIFKFLHVNLYGYEEEGYIALDTDDLKVLTIDKIGD